MILIVRILEYYGEEMIGSLYFFFKKKIIFLKIGNCQK